MGSISTWFFLLSAVAFVGLSIALGIGVFKQPLEAAEAFKAAVMVGLAELIYLFTTARANLARIEERTRPATEPTPIILPPYTVSEELKSLLLSKPGTEVWLICYGTNKFGKVLDTVIEHCQSVTVHMVMCHPDASLYPGDAPSLDRVASELAHCTNVEIIQSRILPTMRAALVKDSRGVPIWAALSYYVLYPAERSLKSEGLCPTIRISNPASPLMTPVGTVIEKEFERLRESSLSPA